MSETAAIVLIAFLPCVTWVASLLIIFWRRG